MTQVVGEGFFADVVVLVEGETEVGALWRVQEVLDLGWEKESLALVAVRGKGNLDRPAIVFGGLGIRTYVVFDADRRHQGGVGDRQNQRLNQALLRLVGEDSEDPYPSTTVKPTWAVFEDRIEATLVSELGEEALLEILDQAARVLDCEHGLKALKKAQVADWVVEKVYERGLRVPTLEAMARAVAALLP